MAIYDGKCVSHGTLRNQDLLAAFGSELRNAPDVAWDHLQLAEEADAMLELETYDSEDGSELVNELIDALTAYAPDGCYFGTHPGDGSDFGFYQAEDN
jgi:hypothetical protein